MIKNYFNIAWRNIVKNKTVSVINVLGLTLGITACLIIYLDTSFELSYDNFQSEKERIYRVVTSSSDGSENIKYRPSVPDPMAAAIRTEFTGIEKVAQFHNYYAKVSIPARGRATKTFDAANEREEEASDIIISDPEYFDLFKYEWMAGNAASMKQPFRVTLTESKAMKYFGDISPNQMIGREIIYNDSLRLFVSGIVKNYPGNSDFLFSDIISSATIRESFLKNNFDFANWQRWTKVSQTFVKMSKGATPFQFQQQTPDIVKKNMDIGKGIKVSISLQPLSDIHFNDKYKAAYGRNAHLSTLYGLMAIAIFILLIAVVNYINLATAQSLQRAKEIGIRKVLGSSRGSLVIYFLCETFIITMLSVILSLIIIPPLIGAFHSFLPDGIALSPNVPTITFLLFIAIGTSLFAGFYPAKILSAYAPVLTLKGAHFQQDSGKNYLRKGLIIFQFAISLIFIIGTLVIGNQLNYVLNKDMGFAKNAIINIPGNQHYPREKMQILAQQIKQLQGVEMVSVGLGTPAEESHWSTILKSKELNGAEVGSQFQAGDENYIPLYELRLVAGRNLYPSDTMKEYLINETLARELGFKRPEDAIGKTISGGGDDGTASHKLLPIVGVLADFHSQSLHETIAATFMSTSKKYSRMISVKLSTQGKQISHFRESITKIESLWKKVYPNEKFDYRFFDQTIAKFYAKELKTAQLMNIAMGIAICISCMGLFGLVTFAAQKRTKEIGIRKVLGATVADIVSMLSLDFIKLVLLGFLIASPLAYYFMHQWLQDFAYRVNISWWTFILAGLAATAIALATVSFQAIRAAIANPVKSLRAE